MKIPDGFVEVLTKEWDKLPGFVKAGIILLISLEGLILFVLKKETEDILLRLYPGREQEALFALVILILPLSSFIIPSLITTLFSIVQPRSRQSASSSKPKVLLTPGVSAHPESELIGKFRLKRHQVIANVHDEYSLELDTQIRTTLTELNAQRRKQGLKEYYPSTRFRLIRPPEFTETGIELHLAPMNFAYLIMLKDPNVAVPIREYVRDQIQRIASRIPKRIQSTHPILNGRNYHPLGVEIAIVTKDKRTLLRRRGESVLLSTVEWDVSYSGYCGEVDRLPSGELDIALTVEHELLREIGLLTYDHREIVFTGLHRNANTGAIDILGAWPTEAKTSELVELLADKYPGIKKVFETTIRTEEPFVWDATNLIVDFNGPAISQALKEIGAKEGKPSILIPEGFMCLLLGLEATGYSTSELAY